MTKYYLKKSVFSDRFTRGFISGLLGGVLIFPLNMFSKLLFDTLAFSDFAGVIIFGHKPISIPEFILATCGVFFFEAFLGGVFAHLITGVQSKNLYLKAWVFSCLVWFGSYAISILFKVPELANIPFKTALSNFIDATIWGLFLAYSLIILDKKYHR